MHVFNRDGQFGQFIFSAAIRNLKMRVYASYLYPLSTYTSNTNASDEHLFISILQIFVMNTDWCELSFKVKKQCI